ncbi:hypothetical protein GCM10009092_13730 [Bowmanella denitrificans]|uniref:Uncharacterized protein n=1 Tax=Bowmanella denitrificans TaxID=366582 RepID=A0ABN0WYP3_9ALTE
MILVRQLTNASIRTLASSRLLRGLHGLPRLSNNSYTNLDVWYGTAAPGLLVALTDVEFSGL